MGHKFAEIAFTETVQKVQQQQGSRAGYASMLQGPDFNGPLGPREAEFLALRDSFYMATVNEAGWPYVQHRGGPAGFMKVLDANTIGFADFSGNRQYVSTGNLLGNDRISLFFMDYPHKTRLKILGRVEIVGLEQNDLLAKLEPENSRAPVERGFLIHIEGFDWNCPKYITPRFTQEEVMSVIEPLETENKRLQALLAQQGSISASTVSRQRFGEGELSMRISAIEQQTEDIRSYTLVASDGGLLPQVEAGAHLALPVMLADGSGGVRQYSICSDPSQRRYYQVAIKAETEGEGGSIAIHQLYQLGNEVNTALPANHFSLNNTEVPVVLVAGGIGITAIRSMALQLLAENRDFELHYSGRSRQQMAFVEGLAETLGVRCNVYLSDLHERLSLVKLFENLPNISEVYLCGPDRLLDEAAKLTVKYGLQKRVFWERFSALAFSDNQPLQLELARTQKVVNVSADETVLDALLDAGVEVAYSCRAGQCRSCSVQVLEGEILHRDTALSEQDRNAGVMVCCVSRAKNGYLKLDL